MGGTPRFDVYSVARPSILHRSTSRSISLRVETSAHRSRLPFSRILRDNGILVEKYARPARKSQHRNRFDEIEFERGNISPRRVYIKGSRFVRCFQVDSSISLAERCTPLRGYVTRHVLAAAPNAQSNHDEKFGRAHEFASYRKYDID